MWPSQPKYLQFGPLQNILLTFLGDAPGVYKTVLKASITHNSYNIRLFETSMMPHTRSWNSSNH